MQNTHTQLIDFGRLPVLGGELPADTPGSELAPAAHAVLDVLLIEDNPGDARLIREMLVEANAGPVRLTHVDRLAAGLEHLSQVHPDVILLDLGLPDSRGLDSFTRLRAAAPGVPVVVLSGLTDATLALRAVQAGAQDYLLKGHVDAEVVVRALRYAVEHMRIEERQRFLSEASRLLASSLDYESTLACAVQLPVPFVADACILQLLPDAHSAPRLVVRAADSAHEAQLSEIRDWSRLEPAERSSLGLTAALVVDLLAHGRELGKIVLLRTSPRPSFGREDARLVDELALRCALAVENARLHRELQLAVRLRDEVLATTSHDLRSPLSGMQLQGVLLRRLLRAGTADSAADADLHQRVMCGLDEMDAAIGRSLGLIQELLDAAALQAGRELQLDRRPTDLAALTRRVAAERQARTSFHTIQVRVAGDGPLVGEWDPLRLGRVLDNLLSNALKYSPQPDSITVDLAREADAEGEWAVIRVHDHGVGIPAAELGRVFDRFYRGSNVASGIRGVGVGLAGVRQIMQQHAGRISVESQEGVGSTFTVRLPLGPVPGPSRRCLA